jgi:hypothetical protein
VTHKSGRPKTGQTVKRPKGGRPRRDPAGVAKPLAIRLTADERAKIERAADRDGVSVSDWARRAMLSAAQGV